MDIQAGTTASLVKLWEKGAHSSALNIKGTKIGLIIKDKDIKDKEVTPQNEVSHRVSGSYRPGRSNLGNVDNKEMFSISWGKKELFCPKNWQKGPKPLEGSI